MRALPHDERELFIAASHSHVLAFDNLSGLPPWLSDTLCQGLMVQSYVDKYNHHAVKPLPKP